MPWFHQRPNLLTMYGSLTPLPFQRRFTLLASAGMQYYTFPTWTAGGDYLISGEVGFTGVVTRLFGNSSHFNGRVLINADGSINWRPISFSNSGEITTDAGAVPLNKLSHIEVERVGTSGFIRVNGVQVATGTGISGNCTVDVIQRNSDSYGSGYIANVSLQTAGDNRLYKLDENFGETSVVKNDLATLGSELWTGDIIGSPWVDNGGNNYAIDGSQGSPAFISSSVSYSPETTLLVNVTTNSKSGLGDVFFNASGVLKSVSGIGNHTFAISSGFDAASLQFFVEPGVAADITIHSVNQADGYGTAINIAESQLFTEVADGWEGVELWTYGVTVSNGAEGSFTQLNGVSSGGVPVGSVIRWTFDVSNLIVGDIRYRMNSEWVVIATANGEYSGDQTVNSSELDVWVGANQCNAGTTAVSTAKEFLEVA